MSLHPAWTFPEATSWKLREKLSFSGDDFQIMDEEGNVVIEAKAASIFNAFGGGKKSFAAAMTDDMKDKVTFHDTNTQEELFSIKKKWDFHPSYKIEVKGKTVAVLKQNRFSFAGEIKVWSKEEDDSPVLFTVRAPWQCEPWRLKCGYSSRKKEFFQGDSDDADDMVADSKEVWCNMLEFCGQDEYEVDVDAGVDVLMIFAILVACDEMAEDAQKQH